MKEQPRTQVTHFRNKQNEKTANPAKLVYEKFYVHQKISRTRNCRRKFIENLLPEKRKETIAI